MGAGPCALFPAGDPTCSDCEELSCPGNLGLLAVAQRFPQGFVPPSGSEPLGNASHDCFIWIFPCGPGRAQEPTSCDEVQGASGSWAGAVSELDPDPAPRRQCG